MKIFVRLIILICCSFIFLSFKNIKGNDEIELLTGERVVFFNNFLAFYKVTGKVISVREAKINVDIETCGKSHVDKSSLQYLKMPKKLKKEILNCGTSYVLLQNGIKYYIHSNKEFDCSIKKSIILDVKIIQFFIYKNKEYYNFVMLNVK